MKKILIFFAAGCLGALVNSIAVWLFGDLGITSSFGVSISSSLTPGWLYPRIVWGGLWGLLFLSLAWTSRKFIHRVYRWCASPMAGFNTSFV
ncbi:hypothetical protein BuS5_02591 [Desulfosarcina sp. BuS5]|uniref:hypothetical protein n=1 Tax=Desulfosarcina sp. BuS5 TaxID=933262 RepID=UPI000AD74D93|nr:hypothetical protein [Desulfosarcina sp. BuS5]WDN89623.1 hypothetical protein BuS5_02591 [Desulfosarcina sp. BuS5]